MTQRLMGMVTALVVVLGLSAAVAEDAMKGQTKEKQGATKECPLESIGTREGIKDIGVKSCPLCEMMSDAPSPAAWILSKREDLSLTEDQIDDLQDLDEDFRSDIADYDAEIVKSRAALNKVFVREKWDAGDLQDALEESAEANIDYITAWAEGKEDAFDELTDAQRTKLMDTACKRQASAKGMERADRPMDRSEGMD